MQEKNLQNFWQSLPANAVFKTTEGSAAMVHHPGQLNRHQGPDFLNAGFTVNNTRYIGDVEIHVKSSGWLAHGHHLDSWYRKVLLHVVWENDRDLQILDIARPPFTIILSSQLCQKQLKVTNPLPSRSDLRAAARVRLERKINQYEQPSFSEEQFRYQLFLSLWQACGYPHNQGAFYRFARWLYPYVKTGEQPVSPDVIFPVLSYCLKAAQLWIHFSRMEAFHRFHGKPAGISRRLLPSRICWNMGKVHPVNHPVFKIWEFLILLTGTSWNKLCDHLIEEIMSRSPGHQLLLRLSRLFLLPEPVNEITRWFSRSRIIEWMMSAVIPLGMAYYRSRKELGMEAYLEDLYLQLPAGHHFLQKRLTVQFSFAWQYQGFLEWERMGRGEWVNCLICKR